MLESLYQTPAKIIDVVKNISRVFPLADLPVPEEGDTCVIVGSGGVLLEFPGLGKLIDSYDHVIRFNLAPTKNFEVGFCSRSFHKIRVR